MPSGVHQAAEREAAASQLSAVLQFAFAHFEFGSAAQTGPDAVLNFEL
jgi:hypothetical protein